MADAHHADRAAQALIAARDRLGAHADGNPPATIALLEGAIVAAVHRRWRRRIVLSCFATGIATSVAVASTLWLQGTPTSPSAPGETARMPWPPANRPSRVVADPSSQPDPALGPVPTARVSAPRRAQRPSRPPRLPSPAGPATAASPAGPSEADEGSTLAVENDLFTAALRAKHGDDRLAAIRILDDLIRLYPGSPLRDSAAAERLKLLSSSE